MRTWTDDPYKLELFETPHTIGSHTRIGYRLRRHGRTVFVGDDIGVPPTDTLDGDDTLHGVLTFLSLRPGDTDPEHFDTYTPEQLAWRDEHAEELAIRLEEHRERPHRPDEDEPGF